MEFQIERSRLSQALDAVSDIVPSRTAIPVLNHLLLEVANSADGNGLLTISATDLDMSITTSVPAQVNSSGRFTVPARKFADIMRELPEGIISITSDENKVTIATAGADMPGGLAAGQGIYILMGVPAEDYPELPTDIDGVVFPFGGERGLQGDSFKSMIAKTHFAVSRDETRPVLNGVLCQITEAGIVMVATDGHRLVRTSQKVDLKDFVSGEDRIESIIPPRALQHLLKLLSGEKALARCVISANHILFDLQETRLFSRLIEGPYVDYEQVIPKNNNNRICVSLNALTPAVRRVSILANTQTHQIRVQVRKDELLLSATSQDVGGEAREVVRADYSGEAMEIGYNSVYLLDILRRIDSDEVMFDLDTPVTAGIVRPGVQEDGADYFCLLMPLRLSE